MTDQETSTPETESEEEPTGSDDADEPTGKEEGAPLDPDHQTGSDDDEPSEKTDDPTDAGEPSERTDDTPLDPDHRVLTDGAEDTQSPALEFPVVGVGASAGGLEAMGSLLEAFKTDDPIALAYVPHLDPTHHSQLVDILQRKTALDVVEIRDGAKVEAGTLYVAPPNAMVALKDGHLHIIARPGAHGHHNVIDRFFRSLAEDQAPNCAGVILSGTLSDGVQGMKELKAAGAATLVQDEASAKFKEMPRNVLSAGYADRALSPAGIAKELVDLASHPDRLAPLMRPGSLSRADEDRLQDLLEVVATAKGTDFSQYKRPTLLRRIQRRMMACKTETLEAYLDRVSSDRDEVEALHDAILISVTRFFRDPEAWTALQEEVLPRLLEDRDRRQPIRVWAPGCATGEEVYSLAILLQEYLTDHQKDIRFQIFGTDISEKAIDVARRGWYPESIAEDVSKDRLARFFEETEGGYMVDRGIRGACIFSVHDLTSDPPFSKLDLVACRNVLIYMEPRLQRRVVHLLHYALRTKGCLILGTAESIGSYAKIFQPLDAKQKIFTKVGSSSDQTARMHEVSFGVPRGHKTERRTKDQGLDLQREVTEAILQRHGPPGVVVDESLDIVSFRGDTSPFFSHPSGPASLNVMDVARDGLRLAIRSAVKEAIKEKQTVRRESLHVAPAKELVDVEVTPLGSDEEHAYFLALVLERDAAADTPRKTDRQAGGSGTQLEALEQELENTKDYLQSVVEDYEATNEELRAANEEAMSTNEELQSTNEELETAQEELHSTNEELTTLNDDLQERNHEVQRVNNDLINILNSVELPIVILGQNLRIRRFTPEAQKLLRLIPSDVGRPLTDLNHGLVVKEGLESAIHAVMYDFKRRELMAKTRDGKDMEMRLRPYRTTDQRIEGVVVLMMDPAAGK